MSTPLNFKRSDSIPINPNALRFFHDDPVNVFDNPRDLPPFNENVQGEPFDFFNISCSAPAHSFHRPPSDSPETPGSPQTLCGSVDVDSRRERHRTVERNRRQRLNQSFETLKEICRCGKKDKASILQMAIDTISSLRETRSGESENLRIEMLERENAALKALIHQKDTNAQEGASGCTTCRGVSSASLAFGGYLEKVDIPMALIELNGNFLLRNQSFDRLLSLPYECPSIFDVTVKDFRTPTYNAMNALLNGTHWKNIHEIETMFVVGSDGSLVRGRLTLGLLRGTSSVSGFSAIFVPIEILADRKEHNLLPGLMDNFMEL